MSEPRPIATPAAGWPQAVDEILAGDQAVALAYVTPAKGVVLLPLTNTGIRDRPTGRVTPVSSSVGMWKKLRRIEANPRIAVAYHSRVHGFTERSEYVLLQGRASLTAVEDRAWVERHRENWERFSGPRDVGRLAEIYLRAYHWRVGVDVDVERFVVWPDLACRGQAATHGTPLSPLPPSPQRPPRGGTGPRVNHRRAAKRAGRLPHVLLAWVGDDGYPFVVPVEVAGTEPAGIALELPEGVDAPPGGRRGALLAHSFARYTFGQIQRKHTGWLEAGAGGRRVLYAPHTEGGYHLPESRVLYRIAAGWVTNRGLIEARRAGFVQR